MANARSAYCLSGRLQVSPRDKRRKLLLVSMEGLRESGAVVV